MSVRVPTAEEVENALDVLRRDYLGDVERVRDEFAEVWESGDFTDRDTAVEALDQMVEGTQRVIYTREAWLCMLFSNNEGAYEDQMGEKPENVEAGAFFAMRQDVIDDLSRDGIDINDDPPSPTRRETIRMAEAIEALGVVGYVSPDEDKGEVVLDAGRNETAICIEVRYIPDNNGWTVASDLDDTQYEPSDPQSFEDAVNEVQTIMSRWEERHSY
jgi:hypothetical protein